jgi:hypothetical protein
MGKSAKPVANIQNHPNTLSQYACLPLHATNILMMLSYRLHTLAGAGETISGLSNANVDHQLLDEQLTHGVGELLLLLCADGGLQCHKSISSKIVGVRSSVSTWGRF